MPLDGEQYLAMVRSEADAAPRIMVARQRPPAREKTPPPPAPAGPDTPLPTSEWRAVFLERFRRLRASIAALPARAAPPALPRTRDEGAWYYFVHGRPAPTPEERERMDGSDDEVEDLVGAGELVGAEDGDIAWDDGHGEWMDEDEGEGEDEEGEDEDEGEDDEDGENEEEWEDEEEAEAEDEGEAEDENEGEAMAAAGAPAGAAAGADAEAGQPGSVLPPRTWHGYMFKEPTTSIVEALDTDDILFVLNLFRRWLMHPVARADAAAIHPVYTRWILSLLARLDARLCGEEIAALRSLVRRTVTCIRHARAGARADAAHEAAAWMVVAGVAGTWGQWDLWDEARASLSS